MIKKIILAIICSGFLLTPFLKAEVFGQAIFLAEIDGEIKAGTHQYLKRVIKLAEEEKAEYLIIKLDTPGGLLKATKDIVDLVLATPVKTIVFVHKEGGWSYSAGTFILLAADFAISHPEASIGAAQPREMAIDKIKETDPKIIEGMASWIKSLAEANQKNPEIAEKFVRENLTLTGKEAKEPGIIDETAKNLEELFFKLNISEPKITKISPTAVEKIFDFLSHPYLVSLLLTIGGLAIIMAIRTGEFELTGIIGVISLLIGLWGIGIMTFSFLGIGLILLGLFLLMMEIFEPGFGIFGIAGTIAILLGIFTFEAEPFFSPQFFDAMTMLVIGAALAICILFVIIGRGVAKTLKSKPKTGPEALIGLEAEVIEELKPLGRVKIKEETWLAESLDGKNIPQKSKVEIIKVEGNTLIVKIPNTKHQIPNNIQ
jgi:membrane-bound serine protease (ClpP class)